MLSDDVEVVVTRNASAAKLAAIETNRESAANMRHDYMNQLIARSAQQTKELHQPQRADHAHDTNSASSLPARLGGLQERYDVEY